MSLLLNIKTHLSLNTSTYRLLGCVPQSAERNEMQDLCLLELLTQLDNLCRWNYTLKAECQISDRGHGDVLIYQPIPIQLLRTVLRSRNMEMDKAKLHPRKMQINHSQLRDISQNWTYMDQ